MLRVAGIFAGRTVDKGFVEAGRLGLEAARDRLGVSISLREGVKPDPDSIIAAGRGAATSGADLIVLHSGDSDPAGLALAAEYPAIRFLVTGGDVARPNLDSWGIRQYQSAFLAGAAAGLLTRTNVVGHLSGIAIPPGLRSRAAFADGLRHTNAATRLLTTFCGNQDDPERAYRAARAQIGAGADLLFTMLNFGRPGAIAACREAATRQIGNIRNWIAEEPEIFVASAVADAGQAVLRWVAERLADPKRPGRCMLIGLEEPEVVRLELSAEVETSVHQQIKSLTAEILGGRLTIKLEYEGPEFAVSA